MDCLLSIFNAFTYNRNLFIMRETLFGEWTHDLLPLCDLQTCSGLGLSNNFLRYMTAFGTDSAGKTSIASWHKISVFSFHVHTVMSLQDSVCLSERLQQKKTKITAWIYTKFSKLVVFFCCIKLHVELEEKSKFQVDSGYVSWFSQ